MLPSQSSRRWCTRSSTEYAITLVGSATRRTLTCTCLARRQLLGPVATRLPLSALPASAVATGGQTYDTWLRHGCESGRYARAVGCSPRPDAEARGPRRSTGERAHAAGTLGLPCGYSTDYLDTTSLNSCECTHLRRPCARVERRSSLPRPAHDPRPPGRMGPLPHHETPPRTTTTRSTCPHTSPGGRFSTRAT